VSFHVPCHLMSSYVISCHFLSLTEVVDPDVPLEAILGPLQVRHRHPPVSCNLMSLMSSNVISCHFLSLTEVVDPDVALEAVLGPLQVRHRHHPRVQDLMKDT
jgi:hypothetical protein